jgi:hypothetical protein
MGAGKYKLLLALFMSLVITGDMNVAQDKKGSQQEQRFFPVENPDEVYIRKPITVPDAAIQTLRSSDTGLRCLEEYDHKFDPAWVVGSEVHLEGSGETAIIVMPKLDLQLPLDNSCMRGAANNTYWVLLKGNKGYQLLLETMALGLEVEDSRHNGYLNIITYVHLNVSETATVYYRFNGKRYQEYKRKVTKR